MGAQGGRRDAQLTDVSVPQPQYQVISPDQAKAIYTEEQAVVDIKDRLASIDSAIIDIRKDIQVIKDTNAVVRFVVVCIEILVPGLIIAAFSVWFTYWLKKPKPRRPTKAGSVAM